MTRLLAFDCSASSCSVAVWSEQAVVAHRRREMARGHAEALMPMIRGALDEAALPFAALDGVVVTVGPGSFTGIRVGLAAARGIGLAVGRPVVGVTAFEAHARAVPPSLLLGRTLVVAIDTRRRDLFVQRDPLGASPGAPVIAAPGELSTALPRGPLVLAGDGVATLGRILAASGRDIRVDDGGRAGPDAGHVASLGAERMAAGDTARPPVPLYLHKPEARLPKAAGRLRP